MNSFRQADIDLLKKILEEEGITDDERDMFADMLASLMDRFELTEKQRSRLRQVGERVGIYFDYKNLASEGKVPRGREVESMVRDHPLKPPGRS